MKKIIMMKGLPASGKTTLAKKLVDSSNGRLKRISKDDLRAMLDNGKHSRESEKLVVIVRDMLAELFLESGRGVIIDDTNLNPVHEIALKNLAVECKVPFFTVDMTESITPEECIKRDLGRSNSVGSKVIMDMYKKYIKNPAEVQVYNKSNFEAIICDIDGTLAKITDRSPYDTAKCDRDIVNRNVADVVRTYYKHKGRTVILVSGREEKFRDLTVKWLSQNGIFYDQLYMRPTDDFRPDTEVKKEIFDRHIRNKYNVMFVLDDRDRVVNMWRDLGLTCLQVAEGDF